MMQNDEEETQRSKSAQETEEVAATRLIINPEAEPTYIQMEILSNLNPRFRLTWEMKRSIWRTQAPSATTWNWPILASRQTCMTR